MKHRRIALWPNCSSKIWLASHTLEATTGLINDPPVLQRCSYSCTGDDSSLLPTRGVAHCASRKKASVQTEWTGGHRPDRADRTRPTQDCLPQDSAPAFV